MTGFDPPTSACDDHRTEKAGVWWLNRKQTQTGAPSLLQAFGCPGFCPSGENWIKCITAVMLPTISSGGNRAPVLSGAADDAAKSILFHEALPDPPPEG